MRPKHAKYLKTNLYRIYNNLSNIIKFVPNHNPMNIIYFIAKF